MLYPDESLLIDRDNYIYTALVACIQLYYFGSNYETKLFFVSGLLGCLTDIYG